MDEALFAFFVLEEASDAPDIGNTLADIAQRTGGARRRRDDDAVLRLARVERLGQLVKNIFRIAAAGDDQILGTSRSDQQQGHPHDPPLAHDT